MVVANRPCKKDYCNNNDTARIMRADEVDDTNAGQSFLLPIILNVIACSSGHKMVLSQLLVN